MGLFDKLKEQALNKVNELSAALQENANEVQNQQGETSSFSSQQVAPQSVPPSSSSKFTGESEGIYGNYMEHLIEMALADGELTEKEKQVLFKKAEAAGIDLDEFEMVLDARLYEKQKDMQASQPVSVGGAAPKSDKYGDVRKCPGCGAIVESFITRCPDCGHEFSNTGTVSSFHLLSTKLEWLEDEKSGGFWGMIKDESIDKKKASLINGFPVPTTKEDLLEFISMATPLAKPATKPMLFSGLNSVDYQVAKAWKAKCEQVVMKARFSMKDDRTTLAEIERYAQELKIK